MHNMASLDDVTQYLAKRVTDALFPGGVSVPCIVNAFIKIYPGWPIPGALQTDIEAGGMHVSVWPLPTERRINPPLGRPWQSHSLSDSVLRQAARELHRQMRDFQITVWAPTPQLRNQVGSVIDTALSEQCHIDLEDGAPAQMFYARQFDSDRSENWHVYRRDLIFSVNYATTQTILAPEVTDLDVTVNGHKYSR